MAQALSKIEEETWSIYPRSVAEARSFIQRRATQSLAAKAAKLILNSYPQAIRAANEDVYASQVVMLFMEYPPEIVLALAKPGSGVIGKLKWLPSVAELKEEADYLLSFAQRRIAYSEPWTENRPRIDRESLRKIAFQPKGI